MSGNTAVIEPLVAPPRENPAGTGERVRRLRLLPAPSARRRERPTVFYALVVVATVGTVLAAQLILSIALSDGAYRISSLETEQRDLSRVQEVIRQDVERFSSPQHLAQNAAALGMVPNTQPAYLRLSDGAVLGAPGDPAGSTPPNNVPNALAANLPVAQPETPAGAATDPAASAGPAATDPAATDPAAAATGEPAPQAPVGPQPWEGQLPAPATH